MGFNVSSNRSKLINAMKTHKDEKSESETHLHVRIAVFPLTSSHCFASFFLNPHRHCAAVCSVSIIFLLFKKKKYHGNDREKSNWYWIVDLIPGGNIHEQTKKKKIKSHRSCINFTTESYTYTTLACLGGNCGCWFSTRKSDLFFYIHHKNSPQDLVPKQHINNTI